MESKPSLLDRSVPEYSRIHPHEGLPMMTTRIVLLLMLVSMLLSCQQGPDETGPAVEAIAIEAHRLGLRDLKLDTEIVGNLKYRGGVTLKSPDKRFGGLSGLHVSADGRDFIALSDRGHRFLGQLVYNTSDNLVGTVNTKIEALQGAKGQRLRAKEWGDAESMAPAPDGGTVVAFERSDRLLVYPGDGRRPSSMKAPKELEDAPTYGGIKALTLLADKRLFALTAGFKAATAELTTTCGVIGWIGGDNGWSNVTYCVEKGFTPTGATTLPGGDVVVVERRQPFVAARLRRLSAAEIKPGVRLKAKTIALLEQALAFHNIQGIDARQASGGEVLIYLVSDDNFLGPQPTAILMFELVE